MGLQPGGERIRAQSQPRQDQQPPQPDKRRRPRSRSLSDVRVACLPQVLHCQGRSDQVHPRDQPCAEDPSGTKAGPGDHGPHVGLRPVLPHEPEDPRPGGQADDDHGVPDQPSVVVHDLGVGDGKAVPRERCRPGGSRRRCPVPTTPRCSRTAPR